MKLNNLGIGFRLAFGFGLLLALILMANAVAIFQFNRVSAVNTQIIEQDWVKAEVASTINATTRANARRTMELLISTDPAQVSLIKERIAVNKKTIDDALATLVQLVRLPEGKALLTTIMERRTAYVASFTKVQELVGQGQRDEATLMMTTETLPAIDALQEPITALSDLQKKVVVASSAEAQQRIDFARQLLGGLALLALFIGVMAARLITRSITHPVAQALALAQRVTEGNLTGSVEVGGKDEMGRLLRALQTMNASLVRIVGDVRGGSEAISTATSQIAAGNLTCCSAPKNRQRHWNRRPHR